MGMGTLDGKSALVTGGSTGIGQAIALAEAGADVAIHYHSSRQGAESCAAQIAAFGRQGAILQADLTAVPEAQGLVEAAAQRFGRLEILVNGVGLASLKNQVQDWTEEEWDQVVDATLKSVFFASQRAAALMMGQRWGRIINISSTITKLASGGMAPYVAAKGGVEALTVALAVELAPHGITVNAVQPSIVPLERNKARWEFYQEEVVPLIPTGRLCRPEDIASAVAHLASPGAEYITGQVLAVDGGWTSRPAHPL
jgi:NAD(P)-dependent dehydrogenase (short-subunit alcohol dehydrogenase family)